MLLSALKVTHPEYTCQIINANMISQMIGLVRRAVVEIVKWLAPFKYGFGLA